MSDPLPDDADGDVLRGLLSQGADLSKEMEIDFNVEVPNREAGMAFEAVVTPLGFRTRVSKDKTKGKWTCSCTRLMVPSYDAIMAVQEILA